MEQATFEQRLAALLVLRFDLYALETDGAGPEGVIIVGGRSCYVAEEPS
jgi:hypothetical protein